MASLDTIIREYCIETGEQNLNRYPRYYQFAVSFLRENSMDMSGIPKMAQLCIHENDTADLPADYLQYRFIGLVDSAGIMHSMGRNDRLALSTCHNEQDIYHPQNIPGVAGFPSIDGMTQSWRNGEFMGKMFGTNGGNNVNGEYRIDLASGRVQFGCLPSRVCGAVMEYIADINSVDGDFEVHPFIIETLKNWISWKSIKNDRNRGIGEKEQAKSDYFREDRLSKRRLQQFTVEEFAQCVRSGNTFSTKW